MVWEVVLAVIGSADRTIVKPVKIVCININHTNLIVVIFVHFGKVVSPLIIQSLVDPRLFISIVHGLLLQHLHLVIVVSLLISLPMGQVILSLKIVNDNLDVIDIDRHFHVLFFVALLTYVYSGSWTHSLQSSRSPYFSFVFFFDQKLWLWTFGIVV